MPAHEVRIRRLVLKRLGSMPAARLAEALEREIARQLDQRNTPAPPTVSASPSPDRLAKSLAPKLVSRISDPGRK